MVWRKSYSPQGALPGTLNSPPDALCDVRITAIQYTSEHYTETQVADLGVYLQDAPQEGVLWLDINGLGDVGVLKILGQHFELHPLSLEDVLNIPQRPKLEDYETYHFLVMRVPIWRGTPGETEQMSLFLGPSYVLTIQERTSEVFEPIRQQIRQARGKIRRRGADYLAYALLDAGIDGFFPLLESLGEQLEDLEDAVLDRPERQTLESIFAMRRALMQLRRTLWPTREAIHAFAQNDLVLVTSDTRFFLRDCYDHVLQVLDVLENYREFAAGLMETYLSSQSNHLNQVMKVLTVIATIFIPLTFVAGIYGMNFNPAAGPWNMPELNWPWGYPVSLLLMAGIAVALLAFFRRRGWL